MKLLAFIAVALCFATQQPVQAGPIASGALAQAASHACEARNHEDNRFTYAEPRQQVLPQASLDRVHASPNGAVIVHGTDRNDVLVHACVYATAPNEQEARGLASQIQIAGGAGEIVANGPNMNNTRHWSVSYEVWLPRASNLDVATVNGSIKLEEVHGDISVSDVNGGLDLIHLGGAVKSSTVNGGVHVELEGAQWDGAGLQVSTTNGGVHIAVPDNYSASVHSSTVNGGIHCDFPVTIQGKLDKNVSFQLGGGGPEIHASTVNGGIHFSRGA